MNEHQRFVVLGIVCLSLLALYALDIYAAWKRRRKR